MFRPGAGWPRARASWRTRWRSTSPRRRRSTTPVARCSSRRSPRSGASCSASTRPVINGAVTAVRDEFHMGDRADRASPCRPPCSAASSAPMPPAGWPTARAGSRSWCSPRCSSSSARIGAGLAFSPWELILWRVIGGLGVGIASVIAPAYIAEIAPASIRGRLGSLQQLAIVTGIFIALLVRRLPRRRGRRRRQRAVVRAGGLALDVPRRRRPGPRLRHAVAAIPESPRYLVAKRRDRRGARRCSARSVKTGHRRRAWSRDPAHRGAGGAARPSRT